MAAIKALHTIGYATIEQDKASAPLEDLAASLDALAAQGVEVP